MIWPTSLMMLFDKIMHEQPQVPRMVESVPEYTDPAWIEMLRQSRAELLFFPGNISCFSESPAFTAERMSLWRHNSTGSPVLLQGSVDIPNVSRAKVRGHLLHLKDKSLDDLDNEMEKGVLFDRKFLNLHLPILDWEGNPQLVVAHAYYARPKLREQIVWDQCFHKKGGLNFSLAPLHFADRSRWLGRFYQYVPGFNNGVSNKCFVYVHRGLNDPEPAKKPEPTVKIDSLTVQAIPHK